MGKIKGRLDPQCTRCDGAGTVPTPDDWEYCPDCVGAPNEPVKRWPPPGWSDFNDEDIPF